MCTIKNLEESLKTWIKFAKNIWQPCENYLKFCAKNCMSKLKKMLMKIYKF